MSTNMGRRFKSWGTYTKLYYSIKPCPSSNTTIIFDVVEVMGHKKK
jgi:hypothetical protein